MTNRRYNDNVLTFKVGDGVGRNNVISSALSKTDAKQFKAKMPKGNNKRRLEIYQSHFFSCSREAVKQSQVLIAFMSLTLRKLKVQLIRGYHQRGTEDLQPKVLIG